MGDAQLTLIDSQGKGVRMGDAQLTLNEPRDKGYSADGIECYIQLMKDRKPISRTRCPNPPSFRMPHSWSISEIVRLKTNEFASGSTPFILLPASENSHQQVEWGQFLGYLQKYSKVAIVKLEPYEFCISPPSEGPLSHAVVSWRLRKTHNIYDCQKHGSPDLHGRDSRDSCTRAEATIPSRKNDSLEKNHVQAHPSYLKTLGQAHSGWIFGAIAELVDNSRDAKATKLEVSINMMHSKIAGGEIPMLSFIDDGHGMTYEEIVKMISFGHKPPDTNDPDQIGRFGIGFKTGAMRLGKDALVLSQTANSRSIAFLSRTLNEEKDSLEIPIVSYHRQRQFMEVDTSIQTEALAEHNFNAIKEFSPFNEYLVGEKAGLFNEKGTGTQIYIWNLDKWGSDYSLEWKTGTCGSSFHQGDISIRSKRIRSRPGQTSREVPLDYSLQSYLEVIFLDPRMKLYVQGSMVRSRPLAKSLSRTVVEAGIIMGKPIELILGRSQLEWDQANCGIFLYWHGRLIEGYKRVGGMIHSADVGRGVIGVIDVTELMDGGDGQVWVHNNKQGFQDCEVYAELEKWLGSRFDQYWDSNFDTIQLRKENALFKPDDEWVQCDKCRKWRLLTAGFDSSKLPQEWFCYMNPFNGKCEMPEQKVRIGVVTVSAKRSRYNSKENPVGCKKMLLVKPCGILDDSSSEEDLGPTGEDEVQRSPLKRLRKGLSRSCKRS